MGVDTRAYYINTTREQIFNFVESVFCSSAKHELRPKINKDYSIINFKYKDENRMMHVHRIIIDVEADMKKWNVEDALRTSSGAHVSEGLPDKSKGTMISLGKWGSSVEIFKLIACYFSGYIDEDDSDSEDYYFIKKDLRKLIKSII
jgi:hypothetical protein